MFGVKGERDEGKWLGGGWAARIMLASSKGAVARQPVLDPPCPGDEKGRKWRRQRPSSPCCRAPSAEWSCAGCGGRALCPDEYSHEELGLATRAECRPFVSGPRQRYRGRGPGSVHWSEWRTRELRTAAATQMKTPDERQTHTPSESAYLLRQPDVPPETGARNAMQPPRETPTTGSEDPRAHTHPPTLVRSRLPPWSKVAGRKSQNSIEMGKKMTRKISKLSRQFGSSVH